MNVEVHEGLVSKDVVLIHGNLASNTWWQPALEEWRKNKRPGQAGRLIMGEWRGCGKSSHPEQESDLEISKMAKDYLNLLEHMKIQSAHLVGHSTGGLIGITAMSLSPERFDRAVLLDPVGMNGVQFGPEMYGAFTQMSQDREFCSAIMSATIHGNDPLSPFFQKIVDDAFAVAPVNWHGIPNVLNQFKLAPKDLESIDSPVLVLHGEHDNVLAKEESVQLAGALKNGRFEELSGQGHSTNVENPERFVQMVNQFLFS